MGFTISADDPRSIKAIEIAAEARHWLKWRTQDGHEAFGIPSQRNADQFYVVTQSTCDCPDFRRAVLTDDKPPEEPGELHACKHILAVRLHCELLKAQQHQSSPSTQRQRGHLRLLSPG